VKPARAFQFSEPGSRVLREFMAERERQRLIAARGRAAMQQREWWSGVAGVSGAGFAGAGVNRLTQSLAQWSGSVNADLDGNISLLRARARQLCANNEHGRRFLSLVANNVIGAAGPTLQVRAYTLAGVLDKVANDAIEMAYATWCKAADVRGLMSLAELERVAIKGVARDGEALIRIVRNNSLTHGIGLQLLEADRLDEAYNTTLRNGNVVRLGVEVNTLLQPVALYMKSRHPGDTRDQGSTTTERIGVNDVLHVYLPERAEQVRGYTWLHAVLLRMNMLHAYEEAAVVAARVGAAKMGVFRRTETSPGNLASMADGVDANGVPQMSAEAGEFMQLPQGWELQNWDPEYPQANFDSFLKACFRGVAAGLDVAAHNLTGDMTEVNYSSARIAELAERDAWSTLQKWWMHRVSMPVYRAWLERALLRGEIRFPDTGKALPADKLQKFTDAARFQPRTWKWVDPAKDIAAVKEEIALGINSRTAVAASQGREIEDIIDELKQETELLKAAGLPTSTQPAPAQPPAAAQPPAEDDDEDEDEDAEEARAERRAVVAALVKLASTSSQPPHITVPVTVPESITHTVEVDDLREMARAVNDQVNAVRDVAERIDDGLGAAQDRLTAVAATANKPRRTVFDADNNPIGSVPVDKLEP
jgi:lambda family phage portal protein